MRRRDLNFGKLNNQKNVHNKLTFQKLHAINLLLKLLKCIQFMSHISRDKELLRSTGKETFLGEPHLDKRSVKADATNRQAVRAMCKRGPSLRRCLIQHRWANEAFGCGFFVNTNERSTQTELLKTVVFQLERCTRLANRGSANGHQHPAALLLGAGERGSPYTRSSAAARNSCQNLQPLAD